MKGYIVSRGSKYENSFPSEIIQVRKQWKSAGGNIKTLNTEFNIE